MRTSILAIAFTFAIPAAIGHAQLTDSPTRIPEVINVTGDAVVSVAPDLIVLDLGMETRDANLAAAIKANTSVMEATLAMLREMKITEKDLETDTMEVTPLWDNRDDQRRLTAYQVRKSLSVTLHDIAKVEEVLTKCLEKGINTVHGIDFRTTELRKYRDQARDMAIKAAKEKATALAGAIGQKIGPAVRIDERSIGSQYRSPWGSTGSNPFMMQNSMQNANFDMPGSAEAMGESMALGKIAITASVGVAFELHP